MKRYLTGLLLFSSLLSTQSFASERCEVQGHASVFLSNGRIFKNIRISDGLFVTRQRTWEDCYNYALKKSKELPSIIPLTVSGMRVSGGSQNTNSHVYFEWSFDDSYFSDTSGKLTRYTEKYESQPLDEDLRYFEDGRLFE